MSPEQNTPIVAAFAMTHTPGLGGQTDKPPADQMQRMMDGFATVRRQISAARPDVIVAFVNDHFDMYTLHAMPGMAIALGDTHWGPTLATEAWLGMPRAPIPGHPAVARTIYQSVVDDGFELFRSESAELVHNVLMPRKYLWPDADIPVVPIFINCFAPPLPTWRRAHALGAAVRKALAGRGERIALMASGGLSHWPPITVDEEHPGDPLMERVLRWQIQGMAAFAQDPDLPLAILQREAEMAASGRNLVNVGWDRQVLRWLADGDSAALLALRHAQVREDAGPGGAEMLMWAALMGAMRDAPADIVMYEAVQEWMGGVGLLSYARSLARP
ncbi:hypothetical protein ACOTDM_09740 [Achromobacter xylosoxidans]